MLHLSKAQSNEVAKQAESMFNDSVSVSIYIGNNANGAVYGRPTTVSVDSVVERKLVTSPEGKEVVSTLSLLVPRKHLWRFTAEAKVEHYNRLYHVIDTRYIKSHGDIVYGEVFCS